MPRISLTVDDRTRLRHTIENRIFELHAAQPASPQCAPDSPDWPDREQNFEDAARRSADDEVVATLTARRSDAIGALRRALLVIDTPGYGVCVDCHLPIALTRLEQEPQGVRCAHCQSKMEPLA